MNVTLAKFQAIGTRQNGEVITTAMFLKVNIFLSSAKSNFFLLASFVERTPLALSFAASRS